jgi:hypothetical protein
MSSPITRSLNHPPGLFDPGGELDGVDAKYHAAFVKTVGATNAGKASYQKQFLRYLSGEQITEHSSIKQCILNGKLAWELYVSGQLQSRRQLTAKASDVSKIPARLLRDRESNLLLSKKIGSDTVPEVAKALEAIGFGDKTAEAINTFVKCMGEFNRISPEHAQISGSSKLLELTCDYVNNVLKLQSGLSIAKMFDSTVTDSTRHHQSTLVPIVKDKLISFLIAKSEPFPGDPVVGSNDVNALRLNADLADSFLAQFPFSTARTYLGAASGVWKNAMTNKTFRANGNPIIVVNPWKHVTKITYDEYPTCILSPTETMAVLLDVL